jgi:hypothetical protein
MLSMAAFVFIQVRMKSTLQLLRTLSVGDSETGGYLFENFGVFSEFFSALPDREENLFNGFSLMLTYDPHFWQNGLLRNG